MKSREYRKKPVVIQAYQADKDGEIKTLEGIMQYHKGDYIITGVKGEQYACREDIFKETYEPLERIPAETKEKFTHELSKELKEYYTKSSGWWGEMVDKMTPDERSKLLKQLDSKQSQKSEETRPTGEEELKNWREKLLKTIGYWYMDNGKHDTTCPVCGINADKLIEFIEEQLSFAREEGRKDGAIEELDRVLYKDWTTTQQMNGHSTRLIFERKVKERLDDLKRFRDSLTNQSKENESTKSI